MFQPLQIRLDFLLIDGTVSAQYSYVLVCFIFLLFNKTQNNSIKIS